MKGILLTAAFSAIYLVDLVTILTQGGSLLGITPPLLTLAYLGACMDILVISKVAPLVISRVAPRVRAVIATHPELSRDQKIALILVGLVAICILVLAMGGRVICMGTPGCL